MYFGSYSLFLGTFNKFVFAYQKIIVFTVIVIIKDYITISPLQKKKKKLHEPNSLSNPPMTNEGMSKDSYRPTNTVVSPSYLIDGL